MWNTCSWYRIVAVAVPLFVLSCFARDSAAQVVIPAPEPFFEWRASDEYGCYPWHVSASKDGRYAVVYDGPKIRVVDSKSKHAKIVREDSSVVSCWTCPQTGGLFVVSLRPGQQIQSGAEGVGGIGQTSATHARLDYLARPSDWYSWKVAWSLPVFYRGIGIQFFEHPDRVAILEREPPKTNSKGRPVKSRADTNLSYIRLFDGEKLAAGKGPRAAVTKRIEVPGLVGALEQVDEKLVVLYHSQVGDSKDLVVSKALVDLKQGELTNETRVCRLVMSQLKRLPRPLLPSGSGSVPETNYFHAHPPFYRNYFPQLQGTRMFWFRGGPEEGDLDRLVMRLQVDPTFYIHSGSTGQKLGALDEHMSVLGDCTLYSHDPKNRQPFWYLDYTAEKNRYIADVVPQGDLYKVLSVDMKRGKQRWYRSLTMWEIDPKQMAAGR